MSAVAVTSCSQTDLELISAIAQSRDEAAFSELIRRYRTEAHQLAFTILGYRAQAEEAVQEAFLRVWIFASSYRGVGPVCAWVFRIVTRESMKAHKKNRFATARLIPINEVVQKRVRYSPLRDIDRLELQQALWHEYFRLSDLDRKLIGLHFGAGMSQRKIGRALAIPQQTISYRINEALRMLRARLSMA